MDVFFKSFFGARWKLDKQGSDTSPGAIQSGFLCSIAASWPRTREAAVLWDLPSAVYPRELASRLFLETVFWNQRSRKLNCFLLEFLAPKYPRNKERKNNIFTLFRCYPVSFGLRILRCLPSWWSSASQPPEPPEEDPCEWFARLSWGDEWSEANLLEPCIYMRGSKHLKISDRWKNSFPTDIWTEFD